MILDLDMMASPEPIGLTSFEPNFVDVPAFFLVTKGLIETEISILISILTWIPWKKMNSPPRPTLLEDF